MESLLSRLSSFERSLKDDSDMRIADDEANAVVRRVVDAVGVGTNAPAEVALVPVYTYVHQIEKTANAFGSSAIVVPSFACHWGIVVGPPESQRLFHLLFVEDTGRETEGSNVGNRPIRFHDASLYRPLAHTKYVGQTHYNTDQLNALGRAMIREFGNYHRVFWNCQTFAKCYLRVITGDHDAKFDSWTAADTSRLFLCAFVVGAPFATTGKVKEKVDAERLIKKIESIPENLPAEEKSAQAIAAIYEELRQDPSWGKELGKLEDTTSRPGFLDRLLRSMFGRNQG